MIDYQVAYTALLWNAFDDATRWTPFVLTYCRSNCILILVVDDNVAVKVWIAILLLHLMLKLLLLLLVDVIARKKNSIRMHLVAIEDLSHHDIVPFSPVVPNLHGLLLIIVHLVDHSAGWGDGCSIYAILQLDVLEINGWLVLLLLICNQRLIICWVSFEVEVPTAGFHSATCTRGSTPCRANSCRTRLSAGVARRFFHICNVTGEIYYRLWWSINFAPTASTSSICRASMFTSRGTSCWWLIWRHLLLYDGRLSTWGCCLLVLHSCRYL